MSESDDTQIQYYADCYDCDRSLSARDTVTGVAHVDTPDGGYARVDVPLCRHCKLKRHGHPCDHCGTLHESIEGASRCCVGVSKAPDCIECGRRMDIGARGYSPEMGHDITWASCECCPIGWGRFTGFVRSDGGSCKHVDGGESA